MVLKVVIECPECGEVEYCNYEWSVPEEVPCPICKSESRVKEQGLVQNYHEPIVLKARYIPLEDIDEPKSRGVPVDEVDYSFVKPPRKSRGTKKEE